MLQVREAMLYDWTLRGVRVRLWKSSGESFEHVALKALGFLLYVTEYPEMKIEYGVGLRYKPDLVAFDEHRRFNFWGECGTVTIKKIQWLLKHARVRRLVIFKFYGAHGFAAQLKSEIEPRYRTAQRLTVISFDQSILNRIPREMDFVPADWYSTIEI